MSGNTVVSGLFISATIGAPAVISDGGGGKEILLYSGISGQTQKIDIAADPTAVGRQSWRQFR